MLEEEFLERHRQKKKRLVLLALLLMLAVLGTIPLIEPPGSFPNAVAEAPTATPPPATPTPIPPTPTVIPDLPTATPMAADAIGPTAEPTASIGVTDSSLRSVTSTVANDAPSRSDVEPNEVDDGASGTNLGQPDEFTSGPAATNQSAGPIEERTSPVLDQADELDSDSSATEDTATNVGGQISTTPSAAGESDPALSNAAGIDQETSGVPNRADQNTSDLPGTEQTGEEISSSDSTETDTLVPEAEGSSAETDADSLPTPETSSAVSPDSKDTEISDGAPPPGGLPTTGDLAATEFGTHWKIIVIAGAMVLLLLGMGVIATLNETRGL